MRDSKTNQQWLHDEGSASKGLARLVRKMAIAMAMAMATVMEMEISEILFRSLIFSSAGPAPSSAPAQ
jgi:hypothetical protein